MKNQVTVIPSDKLIIVDGRALNWDFIIPTGFETVHAIQWLNGGGHMEFIDDYNQEISGQELYDSEVKPFVDLWEAQKIEDAPPPDPTPEEIKQNRINEINQELNAIDLKSIRPERSIEVKRTDNKINSLDVDTGLEDELATLSRLETQALELRMELHILENSSGAIKQTEDQTETNLV